MEERSCRVASLPRDQEICLPCHQDSSLGRPDAFPISKDIRPTRIDLASGPELFAAGSADTGRNLRIGFIAYRDKQIPSFTLADSEVQECFLFDGPAQ